MTLIVKNALMIHLPKTGGSFLREVIKKFEPTAKEYKQNGIHGKLEVVKKEYEHDFTFSIVRHPISWYESAWKHIKSVTISGIGWGNRDPHPLSDLDKIFDKDFSKFIDNVIREMPGYYSKALEEYLGKDFAEVDFVAKTETLYDDSAKLLDKLGIKYNIDIIRKSQKFQRSDKTINWKEGQKENILQLESKVIEKFYSK